MKIVNKKAGFDYTLIDKYEAGISLHGSEVKSLRDGRATLDGSFVKLMGMEAYLIGGHIYPYPFSRQEDYDPKRSRKLLLHKKELIKLKHRIDADGLTLIPVSLYTKGRQIKLEIALAKGKKQFEKREVMKKRDDKRNIQRMFRGKVT
jgi:SsrA-binding protein